jgi:hypothetical protein
MKLSFAVLLCGVLAAQSPKPETVQAYQCYVESAEARMRTAERFMTVDSNPALEEQLVRGHKILTFLGNGPNPHKVPGGMLYDWIGAIFIPGTTVDRTVRMLQDYDHRAQYFSEIMSASKLLCRQGEGRFGFSMTLKEPSVVETENDVTWERLDGQRWICRSYSTKVHEIGKQHNYLVRLNSYWRFRETPKGVVVQGQTITLSGEFGSLMRTLGSLAGINPEKSLKKSLELMRETMTKPNMEFALPPAGLPDCGAPYSTPACPTSAAR